MKKASKSSCGKMMPKLKSHLKEDIKQDKSLMKMVAPKVRKMAAKRGK